MKRLSVVVLVVSPLASAAIAALPLLAMRPFAAQTETGLALAYWGRTVGPGLTVVLLGLGLLAAVRLWPVIRPRPGRRLRGSLATGSIALALLVLGGAAFLSRGNPLEQRFLPLPDPGFVHADQAEHLADRDLVLGVVVDGAARAYPVRLLAFHHLVNDVVSGQPLVATY